MLVISRKANQSVVIDGPSRVTIVKIESNKVTIAIQADKKVRILRAELVGRPA